MTATLTSSPVVNKFSAHVTHFQGKKSVCPVLSNIHICLGNVCIYTAVLGGEYTEKQALQEFYRFPGRFKLAPIARILPSEVEQVPESQVP